MKCTPFNYYRCCNCGHRYLFPYPHCWECGKGEVR